MVTHGSAYIISDSLPQVMHRFYLLSVFSDNINMPKVRRVFRARQEYSARTGIAKTLATMREQATPDTLTLCVLILFINDKLIHSVKIHLLIKMGGTRSHVEQQKTS